jgi:hypothetical protein
VRLLLLALAAAAAWVVWRRRGDAGPRVHVVWRDGAELDLSGGSPQRETLVELAERALG